MRDKSRRAVAFYHATANRHLKERWVEGCGGDFDHFVRSDDLSHLRCVRRCLLHRVESAARLITFQNDAVATPTLAHSRAVHRASDVLFTAQFRPQLGVPAIAFTLAVEVIAGIGSGLRDRRPFDVPRFEAEHLLALAGVGAGAGGSNHTAFLWACGFALG